MVMINGSSFSEVSTFTPIRTYLWELLCGVTNADSTNAPEPACSVQDPLPAFDTTSRGPRPHDVHKSKYRVIQTTPPALRGRINMPQSSAPADAARELRREGLSLFTNVFLQTAVLRNASLHPCLPACPSVMIIRQQRAHGHYKRPL